MTDYYDPLSPYLGNSNLRILLDKNGGRCEKSDEDGFAMIDWIYRKDSYYDLRQMIVYCGSDGM